MKKSGFFSRKVKAERSLDAERTYWRTDEDQPLSLTAPQRGETANSQRALVIGFAALAVAGGAYFATVMLTHNSRHASLFAEADAAVAAPEAAATLPAPSAVVAPVTTPAASAVTAASVATRLAPTAAKPAASAANVDPLKPIPVKVKTITVPAKPRAAPTSAPVVAASSAPATVDQQRLAPAANPTTLDVGVAAYGGDTKALVSEGVTAVLKEASTRKPSNNQVATASIGPEEPETEAADSPEMAGTEATSRKGRIAHAVNMRSAPRSGSSVIGVIPTNSTVSVAPGCKHWCRVSYNGRTGFIYKSFLR